MYSKISMLSRPILILAVKNAAVKLNPAVLYKNPVMFVVEIGAFLTTISGVAQLFSGEFANANFSLQISLWLWFTVFFGNFAEAIAEGRGKAQSESLRKSRKNMMANKINDGTNEVVTIDASALVKGDCVIVKAGEVIPADGTVIKGMAAVDESAITGESAPVIRESGGDRSAVTGGTTVISDSITVQVTVEPGKSFLDKMIALVEGASRKKTPNEIALNILIIGLTIVFLLAVVTLRPFGIFQKVGLHPVTLIAFLICLIPTTIGALLSAIGIAGMDRVLKRNVLAMSGRAVEAAGDVDVLLLDKTGTITIGNRMACEFLPASGVTPTEVARTALMASLFDDTPEGRSIVKLAKAMQINATAPENAKAVPFTAESRMSGLDAHGESYRKGALDSVVQWVSSFGAVVDEDTRKHVTHVSKLGGTPLVVAHGVKVTGVIHLKDVVKPGINERFKRIRTMGIRTVMITGDNRLTAATIAKEAGVDDFLAEAKPEDKFALIKTLKKEGRMVAMSGDGTNDAPALAQADVGLAMNTGTQAAREAGNMIDLDSDPTKIIEIVEIGKQLLITRGALTTFSIANDIAKYFAIIPALFLTALPNLSDLNIMRLESPTSAILSAVIFNAIVIPCLIPLALRGVKYRPRSSLSLLRYNLLVYGLGGVIVPFIGIKVIDVIVSFLHLV